MTLFLSFAIGLTFGLGLIVSGLGNPAKVQGFLDLAGAWDPSLILVMGGAIAVGLVAFRIGGRKALSFLGKPMQLPTQKQIDTRLVVGSALFGVGWGLAGICPGPALVLLGFGATKGIAFVLAMLFGLGLFDLISRRTGPAK
ncbi:DUF6691 family protein [Magnetospirillum fulvum]|uniref:Transporter component n=1 Tax=Magnetospirillum fulvum TaxID=1082 RepID=A0A1H6GPY3_MAGFU|nr:DUF6691 family protein [Magnetospirillum fulvum]SEH25361.1 hypothetical protein SAMN04244559_00183 [Magnetospirillum fulvum]